MLYKAFEQRIAEISPDDEEIRRRDEEEQWLQGGDRDYPQTVVSSLEGLHGSNIISITIWRQKFFTGAGDGTVQCLDMEGIVHWKTPLAKGGVLSLAMSPACRQANNFASLYEDAAHHVLHVNSLWLNSSLQLPCQVLHL